MVDQRERAVVVRHAAQDAGQQPREPRQTGLDADDEALRRTGDRLEAGKGQVGKREARPVRQVVERVEEFGEGRAAEPQEPPRRLVATMRNKMGAEILEHVVRVLAQPCSRRLQDQPGQVFGIGRQRLERIDPQAGRSGDVVPDRIPVGIAEKALKRPIHQTVHAQNPSRTGQD